MIACNEGVYTVEGDAQTIMAEAIFLCKHVMRKVKTQEPDIINELRDSFISLIAKETKEVSNE